MRGPGIKQVLSFALVGLLLAPAVGAWIHGRRPALPPETRPEVGYTAPPLSYTDSQGRARPLEDMNGDPVRLEDHRGRVVFLNFWASWCGPCRSEMPEIQRIEEKYGGRVKVLAVNATAQDNEKAARRFVAELGLTFDVPLDRTGEVLETYRVRFFPTSFFIDGGGVIRAKFEGAMSAAMMEAAVRRAAR